MSARSAVLGFVAGSLVTALVVTWVQGGGRRPSSKSKDKKGREEEHQLLRRKKRSFQQTSSLMTDMMRELWGYIQVAGAADIRSTLEPSFATLPGPLKTLRFKTIDLGTNPMEMNNMYVHDIRDGTVQVDMDMVWNSNCNIELQADYIGSFGVVDLTLSGKLSLWLRPLTNEIPIISGIQYAFINPPKIELNFTGLAQVADFKVIDKAVRDSINSSLLSMVLPNKSLYKMQDNNNFLDTYQLPVGVVKVSAVKGRGFVTEKRLFGKDDIPDVYLNVTVGTSTVWRTKTIQDSENPLWVENQDFLLYDRTQRLTVHAWDEDHGPMDPDDDLGLAETIVGDVLLGRGRQTELELYQNEKRTKSYVTMGCTICPWTTELASLSNIKANEIGGILAIVVPRAFKIPGDRKEAASFVKVSYAGVEFQSAQIVDDVGVDAINPSFDAAFEVPIVAGLPVAGEDAHVKIELMNGISPKEKELGSIVVSFDSLRKANNSTITKTQEFKDTGASLEYRVCLRGVEHPAGRVDDEKHSSRPVASLMKKMMPFRKSKMKGLGEEPLDKVRLTVVKARGLKVQKELFNIDVPDAFCVIEFGSKSDPWTTSIKRNTCKPEWDESHVFLMSDHSEVVSIEMIDKNSRKFDPDQEIGSTKIAVGKLLLAGGTLELELKRSGKATGVFITLQCDLIEEALVL